MNDFPVIHQMAPQYGSTFLSQFQSFDRCSTSYWVSCSGQWCNVLLMVHMAWEKRCQLREHQYNTMMWRAEGALGRWCEEQREHQYNTMMWRAEGALGWWCEEQREHQYNTMMWRAEGALGRWCEVRRNNLNEYTAWVDFFTEWMPRPTDSMKALTVLLFDSLHTHKKQLSGYKTRCSIQ